MPGSRPDPLLAQRAAAARSLTGGASAPRSPNPSLKRVAKYGSSGGEKPKAILCASSKEVLQPHQSDQKTALSRIGRAKRYTLTFINDLSKRDDGRDKRMHSPSQVQQSSVRLRRSIKRHT